MPTDPAPVRDRGGATGPTIAAVEAQEPFIDGRADPRGALIEHGYAFLPDLLPRERVMALREEVLTHAADGGWLAAGTEPAQALAGTEVPRIRETDVFRRVLCAQRFHELGGDPAITAQVASILDAPAFCLPRKILRAAWPRAANGPTAPHQDLPQVGGSPDMITAWIPLGDYVAGDGRLMILAGSHRAGLLRASRPWEIDTDELDLPWHGSDFRAGDVLLFHALSVHAAEPNTSTRLRVSMDTRFQPIDDPVAPESLIADLSDLRWEDVYDGWTSTADRWYWHDLALDVRHRPVTRRGLQARARSRLLGS